MIWNGQGLELSWTKKYFISFIVFGSKDITSNFLLIIGMDKVYNYPEQRIFSSAVYCV
mgnify:CR=1 FL=1